MIFLFKELMEMWNSYKKLCSVKAPIDKVEITISYLTDAKI